MPIQNLGVSAIVAAVTLQEQLALTRARLARNVERLREENELNQAQLGDPKAISLLENEKGNPTLETLVGIAHRLKVDVGELFAPEGPHPAPHGPTTIDITTAVRQAILEVFGELGSAVIERQTVSATAKPRRHAPTARKA